MKLQSFFSTRTYRSLFLTIAIAWFANCGGTATATETANANIGTPGHYMAAIPYKQANRYFVKNDYTGATFSAIKITSAEEFDKIFGKAAVAGSQGKPTPIDFTKQYVLAVIGESTDNNTTIKVASLKKTGGEIVLTYKVNKGAKVSYTLQPALILLVDNKYTGTVRSQKL